MATHYLEESLIAELKKKNEAALRQLYEVHYPMVLQLVRTNSGTEQEAKDVYQEAIIHFYERLQEAEFVLTCKIKTYLYAVSRKLWLKKLAVKSRHVHIDEVERVEGLEEAVQEIDAREREFMAMELALGRLGEPCRSILEDFYIRSMSMDEITEKFGYTNPDNAKNQKYKCLQRLKKIFYKEHNS